MTQLDDLKRERRKLDHTILTAQLSGAPHKYYKHLEDRLERVIDTINNIR